MITASDRAASCGERPRGERPRGERPRGERPRDELLRGELLDGERQTRDEAGGTLARDHAFLGAFIEHGHGLLEGGLGRALVGLVDRRADALDVGPHRGAKVTMMRLTPNALTIAFCRLTVVGHGTSPLRSRVVHARKALKQSLLALTTAELATAPVVGRD